MSPKLAMAGIVTLSALVGCGAPNRSTGGAQTGGSMGTGGTVGAGGSEGGNGAGGTKATGGTSGGAGGSMAGGSGGTLPSTAQGGSGGRGTVASGGTGGGVGGASESTGGVIGASGGGGGGIAPDAAAGGRTSSGGRSGSGGCAQGGGSGGTGGSAGAGGGGSPGSGGSAGGTTGSGGTTTPGRTGPCDIYQAANTPCVAAHSTVRALYGAYSGPLYQVRRASDGSTKDIPVGSDGFVDIAVQDSFCSGGTCTISIIYDQSSMHNDLAKSPDTLWLKNAKEANATQGKITISGHTAYGVYIDNPNAGVGYRNNNCKGTAKNDEPEAMYMVLDGKRFSSICCFDYGNVETSGVDNGNATMEALYWGSSTQWTRGGGNGPWVAADLENGMFEGDSNNAPSNTSITGWAFVTGMLKGPSGNAMGLKAGNAQSGALETKWDGKRPPGYSPMKKEGAIVLGTGGDGSNYGQGTFFEGAITSGSPPDSVDDQVQANIVAAGYGR